MVLTRLVLPTMCDASSEGTSFTAGSKFSGGNQACVAPSSARPSLDPVTHPPHHNSSSALATAHHHNELSDAQCTATPSPSQHLPKYLQYNGGNRQSAFRVFRHAAASEESQAATWSRIGCDLKICILLRLLDFTPLHSETVQTF